METFIKADIFFFLTSIAVIVATVVLVFVGFYLIQTLRNVRDVSEKLRNVATVAEEDFEHIHDQITQTWLGALLFGTKKKARKEKKSRTQ